MKRLRKLLIYLFEKYAFDDWVNKQQDEETERLMKINNCNRGELDELLIDMQLKEIKELTIKKYTDYHGSYHMVDENIIDFLDKWLTLPQQLQSLPEEKCKACYGKKTYSVFE